MDIGQGFHLSEVAQRKGWSTVAAQEWKEQQWQELRGGGGRDGSEMQDTVKLPA